MYDAMTHPQAILGCWTEVQLADLRQGPCDFPVVWALWAGVPGCFCAKKTVA